MGFKEDEPTWCTACETFFNESIQDHGRSEHTSERWDVDLSKTPDDE